MWLRWRTPGYGRKASSNIPAKGSTRMYIETRYAELKSSSGTLKSSRKAELNYFTAAISAADAAHLSVRISVRAASCASRRAHLAARLAMRAPTGLRRSPPPFSGARPTP